MFSEIGLTELSQIKQMPELSSNQDKIKQENITKFNNYETFKIITTVIALIKVQMLEIIEITAWILEPNW